MMHKKDCRACGKGGHPILLGMTLAFAAVGVAGVVMAMRKKGNKLKQAAAEAGCACMDEVRGMTENALENGVQMMDRARQKMQSARSGDAAGSTADESGADAQSGGNGNQNGAGGNSGADGQSNSQNGQNNGQSNSQNGQNGQNDQNSAPDDQSDRKPARRGRPRNE